MTELTRFCDCGQRLNMHEDFYCTPHEDALEDEAHQLNADFDRVPYIPTEDDEERLGWRTW